MLDSCFALQRSQARVQRLAMFALDLQEPLATHKGKQSISSETVLEQG